MNSAPDFFLEEKAFQDADIESEADSIVRNMVRGNFVHPVLNPIESLPQNVWPGNHRKEICLKVPGFEKCIDGRKHSNSDDQPSLLRTVFYKIYFPDYPD